MKKILKIALTFVLGLSLLTACSSNKQEVKQNTQQENQNEATSGLTVGTDMSDYNGFEVKENMFIETTAEDVLKILEDKKSALVYFGFPACPWCEDIVPILNEAAKNQNYPVLYVEARDKDGNLNYSEEIKAKLYDAFDYTLVENENGEKTMYFPYVVRIMDGVVVDAHIGTVDGHVAQERELTEDEIDGLRETFEVMIHDNSVDE